MGGISGRCGEGEVGGWGCEGVILGGIDEARAPWFGGWVRFGKANEYTMFLGSFLFRNWFSVMVRFNDLKYASWL